MVESALEQLKRLNEEQERIERERRELAARARDEVLERVRAELAELNKLGFNFRVVEASEAVAQGGAVEPGARRGTRRTGIREQVLGVIREAGPDGLRSKDIRARLGISDKQGSQAVSNALSALKRANQISIQNGALVAA